MGWPKIYCTNVLKLCILTLDVWVSQEPDPAASRRSVAYPKGPPLELLFHRRALFVRPAAPSPDPDPCPLTPIPCSRSSIFHLPSSPRPSHALSHPQLSRPQFLPRPAGRRHVRCPGRPVRLAQIQFDPPDLEADWKIGLTDAYISGRGFGTYLERVVNTCASTQLSNHALPDDLHPRHSPKSTFGSHAHRVPKLSGSHHQ